MSKKQEEKPKKPTTTRNRKTKAKAKQVELGDMIEEVLNSKPIAPITNAVKKLIWKDGEDCGCEERKQKLNKVFNRLKGSRVRCLTEDNYNILKDILPNVAESIEVEDMVKVARVHASVFNTHFNGVCSSCASRNKRIVEQMKTVLKEYEAE